jgi:uncharacterized protein YprB with RNaseH-like and TPR domain
VEINASVVAKHTKRELEWLATRKCSHGHTYLAHYSCYAKEVEHPTEKTGFLDIETSNLAADFGIILSYCIKEKGGKILHGLITPSELRSKIHDKNLVRKCIQDMEGFTRLVTYYGTRFDIPFIRSRALYHRLSFPTHKSIGHTDVYFWVKFKTRLHGNRLQFACDFFDIPAKEHKLHGGMWTSSLTGDKKSLDYILMHNKEDVESLETLYDLLKPYAAPERGTI